MTTQNRGAALITGASSGIGREIAFLFAADGVPLILVARDKSRLDELAAELRNRFRVAVRVETCDLSDRVALEGLVSRLSNEALTIEFLVNNAGVGLEGAFSVSDAERERSMMDLNMFALVRLTKAFLPSMLARRTGRILLVASTAAFQPGPYLSIYFATKAFVLSFGESLFTELRGSGVTVTTLCPGPTETEFLQRLGENSGLFDTGLPVADAPSVALSGYRALRKGRRLAVPGLVNRLLTLVVRIIPRGLTLSFMGWMIGRKVTLRPRHSKDLPAA